MNFAVTALEEAADRNNERLSNVLHRPIPTHVIERSRGMLDKPLVTAAITERITQLSAERELTPNRILKELMSIGFSNIQDCITYDEDGNPRFDFSVMAPEQWAAVKSIKIESSGPEYALKTKVEVQFHPKLDALKILSQYTGIMADDNGHWRENRPIDPPALPVDATTTQAGDAYAALLGETP